MQDTSYIFRPIENTSEIDQLLNRKSQYADFKYVYENETIELLKRNFSLPGSMYCTVMDGEQFIGFVSCDRDWWESNHFFLREIFIEPAYQGQGLGQALMVMCIDHAKSQSAHGLVTQTAFGNVPMQRLCERNGFVRWPNPQWDEGITYKLLFT